MPRCLDGLEKILIGGDRLTEANSRNIQLAFADGETEEDRLEGLVIKFEDWHAIRNLFEVSIVIINYMHPDTLLLLKKAHFKYCFPRLREVINSVV